MYSTECPAIFKKIVHLVTCTPDSIQHHDKHKIRSHTIYKSNNSPVELPEIKPISFRYATGPVIIIPEPLCREQDPPRPVPSGIFPMQQREPWDLSGLETFFQNTTLPAGPIQLNPWTKINNPALFVSSNFEFIRYNNGNPTFRPYLDSLIEFKDFLLLRMNAPPEKK